MMKAPKGGLPKLAGNPSDVWIAPNLAVPSAWCNSRNRTLAKVATLRLISPDRFLSFE
jgi:hypothetical protein